MTGPYYYTVASLPFLTFEGPLPFSYEAFLERCEPWMSPGDLVQLRLARIDLEHAAVEGATHPMAKRWLAFENTLRNELVRIRARNLDLSPEDYIRPEGGYDASIAGRVERAVEGASPLEAEIHLMRLRWEFLTDNEAGHYFDLTALMIYGLKLQLLERMGKFDKEKGEAVLDLFYHRELDEH